MPTYSLEERNDPPDGGTTLTQAHDRARLPVDQVIAHLFPWPTRGQTFLTRFQARAATERSSLPDEPADALLICTRSIATLAKELDLAYETTHKYVTLYKALGLLHKRKVMGQLAFVLLQGIYLPPATLAANLDYLIGHSRPKIRELAQDVKERCLLYGLLSQDILASLQQLQRLLQPGAGELRRSLEQRFAQAQHLTSTLLQTLLSSRSPGDRHQVDSFHVSEKKQLAARTEESTLVGAAERLRGIPSPANLPGTGSEVDSYRHPQQQESTQSGTVGRRARKAATQNPPQSFSQVDSLPSSEPPESTQNVQQSRFFPPDTGLRPPASTQKVDSSLPSQHGFHLESSSQSGQSERERVDSPGNPPTSAEQVDSAHPANVNVIIHNVIDSLNVNVKGVIEYLRLSFGEEPHKRGYYYNLYKEHRRPDAWLAAAIDTLVGMHRTKTVRDPGHYFYKRCVSFHGGIPPDVAELVRQYGQMTYPQLLQALTQPPVPATRSAAHSPPATRSERLRVSIQLRLPRDREQPGMSQQDLRRTIEVIRNSEATCNWFAVPYRQADGSCALLVDDGLRHQCWVYSLQEWQTRLARMQRPQDLFAPSRNEKI